MDANGIRRIVSVTPGTRRTAAKRPWQVQERSARIEARTPFGDSIRASKVVPIPAFSRQYIDVKEVPLTGARPGMGFEAAPVELDEEEREKAVARA